MQERRREKCLVFLLWLDFCEFACSKVFHWIDEINFNPAFLSESCIRSQSANKIWLLWFKKSRLNELIRWNFVSSSAFNTWKKHIALRTNCLFNFISFYGYFKFDLVHRLLHDQTIALVLLKAHHYFRSFNFHDFIWVFFSGIKMIKKTHKRINIEE